MVLLPILLFISYTTASPAIFSTVRASASEDKYRIPNIFSDISYTISLNIANEVLTTPDVNNFSGSVKIWFKVTEATNVIKLHSSKEYLTLKSVKFNNFDIADEDINLDEETDVLTINCASTGGLTPQRNYNLQITYDGILSTTDMNGFYKSSYQVGDETRYLVTTQFESTYARRALPCFDEPSIKGTFALDLTIPENYEAFSNTGQTQNLTVSDGIKKVSFNISPQMSSYLLAFVVSDFSCTQGEDAEGNDKTPTRVCSRADTENSRKFALELAPKVIQVMNGFTLNNYSAKMDKMDQMAIPDFSGAMENWGLVTYSERGLLIDDEESSNSNKQNVAKTITHEFAHQWFGDLVTCDWWSEIYLNEGFATYFEYYATAELFPDWELEKQFLTDVLQPALEADSYLSSNALKSNVSTPEDISARFDTISYDKGGSVLRMVHHIMSLEKFQTGLQRYLNTKQLSSATSELLWIHLNTNNINQTISNFPENKKLADIMLNWIEQPGYPLVTVTTGENNTVVLTQKRFLVSLSDEDDSNQTGWYIPISYTTSEDEKKFETTNPQLWLTPDDDSITIQLTENVTWIVINNEQTGFYRVSYDSELLLKLAGALKEENFGGIIDTNRAQIVDDLFNVGKVGNVRYDSVFQVLEFLQNDVSYYPWNAAFRGFDYLLKRVGQGSVLGKAISEHILSLSKNLLASVPIDSTDSTNQIYTLNQVQALTWACKLGNQDCVDGATALFENYKNTNTRPEPNLRSIVYCNGLRYSQDTTDWEFLWNQYLTTNIPTEKVLLLSVLGCTKDENRMREYLEKTISGKDIRPQDAVSAFSAVYTNNPEGVDVAFDFLVERYEDIASNYTSLNSVSKLIKGLAELFTTQNQIEALENFIESKDLSESVNAAASAAVKTAKANVEWLSLFEKELNEYYDINDNGGGGNGSSKMTETMGLLFVLCVFMHLF